MTQNVSTDIDQLRLGQINTFPVYDQKNEDKALSAQHVKAVDLKIPRRKVRQRKRRYQRKCHDRRQYKKTSTKLVDYLFGTTTKHVPR